MEEYMYFSVKITTINVFMSLELSLSLPMNKLFQHGMCLVLVAIDEAHCITDW